MKTKPLIGFAFKISFPALKKMQVNVLFAVISTLSNSVSSYSALTAGWV